MAESVLTWQAPVVAWAQWCRARFDVGTTKYPPVLLVAVLAGVAGALGIAVEHFAFLGCRQKPFSLLDLELTFSAPTFSALIRSAAACRGHVALSFATIDLAFPVFYSAFLCALYLWVERYRRFAPGATSPDAGSPPLSALSSLVVILPFIAAAFDLALENLTLGVATVLVSESPAAPGRLLRTLVMVGSWGAALKWSILGVYLLGLLLMLLRGPRRQVLWRLRFSVLAVMLGAPAILLIPQGQDILQRLAEGDNRPVRIGAGVLSLTWAALVVWYSASVLTQVRLPRDPPPSDVEWMDFFEYHIPRLLGIAVLGFGGAAFARAASAFLRFSLVAILSYLLVLALAYRGGGAFLMALGRKFVSPSNHDNIQLTERFGRTVLAIVLGALIVWPRSLKRGGWWYDASSMDAYALKWAAWLSLIAAWALYLFVYYRRDLFSLGPPPSNAEPASKHVALPRPSVLAASAMGILSALCFAGFTWYTVPLSRWLGPLVIVALTIANAVFVGSMLAYLGRKFQLPLVVMLLALAAGFSRWNDNHAIRILDHEPIPDTLDHRGMLRARFETWLRARAAEDPGAIPVVLVAAAGGGLRAAYWSGVALATLQDRDSAFARHVFAISGVSGGSLGAAVFAATVRDMHRHGDGRPLASPPGRATVSGSVRGFMDDDFLSPVLAKMVAPDFLQWFVPIPVPSFDRATALEQSWEASYAASVGPGTFDRGYLAFYADSSLATTTPLLLLNTTHVQTGRRYVTAPFVDGAAFLDSRSVLRALGADLRLSTAVHNSARFSYVSPAGRIERQDGISRGSLVDGGYFENSGLTTLGEVRRVLEGALLAPKAGNSGLELPGRVRLVVIYLCNDPLACRRDLSQDSTLAATRGLAGEWLSPLIALAETRDARGSLARAQMWASPGARLFQLNVCDSLNVRALTDSARFRVARDRVVQPPLGWELSRLARDWMDSSLTQGVSSSSAGTIDTAGTSSGPCRVRNVAALDSITELLAASRRR